MKAAQKPGKRKAPDSLITALRKIRKLPHGRKRLEEISMLLCTFRPIVWRRILLQSQLEELERLEVKGSVSPIDTEAMAELDRRQNELLDSVLQWAKGKEWPRDEDSKQFIEGKIYIDKLWADHRLK